MRKQAYFEIGEEVLVQSEKCPDMNGLGIVVNRMWIEGRKGSKDGWVYQMENRSDGRWLQEKSLKKDLHGCGVAFDVMMAGLATQTGLNPQISFQVIGLPAKLSEKAQAIMDEIERRRRAQGKSHGEE